MKWAADSTWDKLDLFAGFVTAKFNLKLLIVLSVMQQPLNNTNGLYIAKNHHSLHGT